MGAAHVTATSLNLRDAPGGTLVTGLPRGTELNVLQPDQGGWTQVSTLDGSQTGWVSTAFIAPDGAPAAGMPTADTPANPVTTAGNTAVGPDGTVFAHTSGPGFFTSGLTSLDAWLAAAALNGGPSPSAVRVVRAVSANEGKLEAINTYDNSYLSAGLFQWTAGPAGAAGELAALLNTLKLASPDVYQDCFGQYGLDISLASPTSVTGNLTLDGAVLQTDAQKAPLRQAAWAYRFWRAAHAQEMRAAQLTLAASRIARYAGLPASGFTVGQWLSSELGMALVLDEHVNRPGHVPGTLNAAIATLSSADPTSWTTADESALITAYLVKRAATNMTDSDKRAQSIQAAVARGDLSAERGSYQT